MSPGFPVIWLVSDTVFTYRKADRINAFQYIPGHTHRRPTVEALALRNRHRSGDSACRDPALLH
ncbi:hypothetical protein GCM10009540_16120 [Streptomyces turgidiscabies]